jgi:hypothetical protein
VSAWNKPYGSLASRPGEAHVSDDSDLTLAMELAEELSSRGIEPLLIGAAALAVHGYPRVTKDLDFGVAIPPGEMRTLADALSAPNREVELSEPDANDPLGGVITITRTGCLPVQIVNFDNSPAAGFPALVRGAEKRAVAVTDVPGKVVSPEDLVLFKLYAGGHKSHLDIIELFTRCPIDLDALKARAKSYGLTRDLDALLRSVGL